MVKKIEGKFEESAHCGKSERNVMLERREMQLSQRPVCSTTAFFDFFETGTETHCEVEAARHKAEEMFVEHTCLWNTHVCGTHMSLKHSCLRKTYVCKTHIFVEHKCL